MNDENTDEQFGVIFDMDGVLVDSYQPHLESWNRVARRRSVTELTERQFAETFGRRSCEIIRMFWPDAAGEDADIAAWDDEKEADYRAILQRRFPVMDGADDLLASLASAGFRLAIGSSGPAENVAVGLKCLRNGHLFAATVSRAEVSRGKPDPEVFLKAAGKLGLDPRRCAVVEDALPGVAAARAAGMAVIAITGTADRDTLAPRADTVIDCLRELTPRRIAEIIETR